MQQERFRGSDMKTVLVTGGSRGLGLAIVKRLASQGYRVIATARASTPQLEALQTEFPESVRFHPFDLAEPAGIQEFVRGLVKEYGHLYGLVNNAALGHDGVLATMHDSEIS